MKRFTILAETALLVLALSTFMASCGGNSGGGSSSSTETPQETLFVSGNAWSGDIPANAKTVTADEFRSKYEASELKVVTPAAQQEQRTARQRRIDAERAFLESKSDISEEEKALLAQASAAADIDGEATVTLPNGQTFALIDLGTRIVKAAENYRLARDPSNALATYSLSYSLLTDELKAQVPAPDSLQGDLNLIMQATQQLNTALATVVNLDNTRMDPDAPSMTMPAGALNPGNGSDNNGICTPTGLARRYWSPLRSFISPIKSQGSRGTCWAFAAIASVESRERVQNDLPVDLSEQFLVNKVKLEWSASDFVDSGSSAAALNAAIEHNQLLMYEMDWTYNRATGLPNNASTPGVAGTAAAYKGACTGYTGDCSETAHQSQPFCVPMVGGLPYCGYFITTFNGPGIAAGPVRLVWSRSKGDHFALEIYRAMLARGEALIAFFPMYEGFKAAPGTGIVSDYSKQMRNAANVLVDGDYGGHFVQIVGFLSNEEMTFPGSPVNVGGGGYFIIRNSWGCAADGGYYYVPADYVSTLFSSLEVLEFDTRRSARWNSEQVPPGGRTGLAISPGGSRMLDLRVQANLAAAFTVAHPIASYVRLTVSSSRDGIMYNGQWLVNPPANGSIFANSLPVKFQTEGLRTLTITARYGAQVVSTTMDITVINTPPVINLESTGTPQQNENFVINAKVTDINETNPAAMCTAMTWSITPPDIIVPGSGCMRVIKFGATGYREVSVTTHDSEGSSATRAGFFNVSSPPINPYPRITTFGVYSRDLYLNGALSGCRSNPVADNAVIDLREIGCKVSILGADLPRYLSKLVIENPTAEALSYDWTYSISYSVSAPPSYTMTTRTATPSFDMNARVFGLPETAYTCTLDVTVNASEPSRSKSQRVWNGLCINVADVPR